MDELVVVLSAGLLPKRPLVAGAAVVDVPDVAVVVAAGAEVVAAEEPPNRPPLAGADVAAGAEVAGLAPKRPPLAGAGAAEVEVVDAGADVAAAPPKRPPEAGLLPEVAAAKGLAAAVLAGAAAAVVAVCPAGLAPNRLEVVDGAAAAGCDVVAAALPKRPPAVEAGAASGFFPNRLPAPALLSLAAAANTEDPLVAGAAAGVDELVLPNIPPDDGCAAGVLPKRFCFGACACACA